MMALTAKQAQFVSEYLIDLNATQAAIRAGYSKASAKNSGYQNLHTEAVKEAISAAQAARAKRTLITQDAVLADLECIKRDAMETSVDRAGNVSMNNHSVAVKICELQGKHLGLFNDKALPGQKNENEAVTAIRRVIIAPKNNHDGAIS